LGADVDVVFGNGSLYKRIAKGEILKRVCRGLGTGNSKEGNTNLSFKEASISEEPSAVVPHAGICAGAVR